MSCPGIVRCSTVPHTELYAHLWRHWTCLENKVQGRNLKLQMCSQQSHYLWTQWYAQIGGNGILHRVSWTPADILWLKRWTLRANASAGGCILLVQSKVTDVRNRMKSEGIPYPLLLKFQTLPALSSPSSVPYSKSCWDNHLLWVQRKCCAHTLSSIIFPTTFLLFSSSFPLFGFFVP